MTKENVYVHWLEDLRSKDVVILGLEFGLPAEV
jgi:hypothetical protein